MHTAYNITSTPQNPIIRQLIDQNFPSIKPYLILLHSFKDVIVGESRSFTRRSRRIDWNATDEKQRTIGS
jgi:hypothetical protein